MAPPKKKNRRFSDSEVLEIRRLYASGNVSQTDLAKRFRTSRQVVHLLVNGKTWSHLPVSATFYRATSRLTEAQVMEIRQWYASGSATQDVIGRHFGVAGGTISRILKDADPASGSNTVRGETHGRSLLTEPEVRRIRALWAAGGITQRCLAERYGVHLDTIRSLLRRRTWRHLD